MRLSTLHYLALLLGQMVFGADGNIQKTAMTGTRRLPVKDTTRSNRKAAPLKPGSQSGTINDQRKPTTQATRRCEGCSFCGRRLHSYTHFCSEEREIYGFPLTVFKHNQTARYELNILQSGYGKERVGQIIFPSYFKARVAKCRCWNVPVLFNRQDPEGKWPVKLSFGFPPDASENMATSVSRLMKKISSLVCPTPNGQLRRKATFYLAEAQVLLKQKQKQVAVHQLEVVKLVKSGRKAEIDKSSSLDERKIINVSKRLLVLGRRKAETSTKKV
eukprot:m.97928 g.97928  ORF g.97928 m.97928 type:complete len:274 (+) comp36967_c1_seq8:238-1059(+)